MSGKGMVPRKGYNQQRYAENYDGIFRRTQNTMKTKRIKATAETAFKGKPLPSVNGVPRIHLVPINVWRLPNDAESYEQMVKQGAQAICKHLREPNRISWKKWAEESEAVLRAIGITKPKKGT